MTDVLHKMRWWVQDYGYAVARQIHAAVSRRDATSFQSGVRRAVVVIPGVFEPWQFMLPIISALHKSGHPVHVVPALQWNSRDLPSSARIVANHLAAAGLEDVAILAHSKGGLIGKYLMLTMDHDRRIHEMVAICTPFSGSRYARYLLIPSLRLFSPRNALTLQMTKEETLNTRISSIFGIFDPHIPEGSILPGANNIQLPVAGHFRILKDPATLGAVLEQLSPAAPAKPQ